MSTNTEKQRVLQTEYKEVPNQHLQLLKPATQPKKMSSSDQSLKRITKVLPRPTTFLSLAPETSASYPTAQDIKPATHPRRSSSVSSAGTITHRVLKLGPVHYGEHPDGHRDDFHEVAVVE
ncbi:hypothetical protein F4782DRAFT_530829 [Xylaria castorea]|nr:hypothetical protein F4782DRAFT_530829 [Xylaria castorea]